MRVSAKQTLKQGDDKKKIQSDTVQSNGFYFSANNQTNYPYMQQQMPVSYPPQYTTNPVANVPNYNPPAYPDTSPRAGLVQNQA